MASIDEIISTFNSVDRELRLQLLLDYAKKLPAVPPGLETDAESARIHECQTPVWLWLVPENGSVRVHAKVAEEAPTVQGFLSIIAQGYEGASAEELASVPSDLVERLGLGDLIRMNRAIGLHAVTDRVRREARKLTTEGAGA